MKNRLIILLMLWSLSPLAQGVKSMETIGSTLNSKPKNYTISSTNYKLEATKIVEKHKLKLQQALSYAIWQEIELYRNTLDEIDKQSVLTYSITQTNKGIEQVRLSALQSILQNGVRINQIYFELFNELTLLDIKYGVYNMPEHKDYYDAGPIVLAEEVLIKMKELIIDEKIRIKSESKQDYERVIALLSYIPAGNTCTSILNSITKAAKLYKNDRILNSKLTNVAYKLLNKDMSIYISKTFKNQDIRNKLGDKAARIGLGSKIIKNGYSYTEERYIFREISNKIESRVGDYSDGILTVHLQRVRDIVKANAKIIR